VRRASVSILVWCLTLGLLFFSPSLARSAALDGDDEVQERLARSIEHMLDDVDEERGEPDCRIAKIKQVLAELLEMSLQRTAYNEAAAVARAFRDRADFDYADAYASCEGLNDGALKTALLKLVGNHHDLGYTQARRAMFLDFDNVDGTICCVYTGRTKEHVTQMPSSNDMNTEHTWPQSMGATGQAKSDMHHLFITDSKANGVRGNLPFGEVGHAQWEDGGSRCDGDVFEPRADHRGNVARALFYFSVRYTKRIDAAQEAVLRRWHVDDPVDDVERRHHEGVARFQHNRNPFIDRPDFVERIGDF